MSAVTRTREVDTFGNVAYRIEADGEHVGTVLRISSGYLAENLTGSTSGTVTSIKRGIEWLQRYGTQAGAR